MKNLNRILIAISFLTLVNCKSTWVKTTENTVEKINDRSVLIDRIEKIKRKDHFMKSEFYKYGKSKILKSEFFSDTLMRTNSETYLKDSLIIKEVYFGIEALSPPTDKNEPYARVFKEVYYFNSSKNGILKKKEIEIKNFGEYEKAKSKLIEMKFKTTEINHIDYLKIKENYEQIIELFKNTNHNNGYN
ncbi:hypothetical protein QQ020_27140 [Fulvivirgaceae bacterium BMA12]|uniref:Lipoprotein n=1 Tax=Agaribacillus aureus TaxID=3051825 RepID=A0ABT8LDU6_9BACT|nr:hypothetical protein [Fulvivirgaceae bacterium BMA12]